MPVHFQGKKEVVGRPERVEPDKWFGSSPRATGVVDAAAAPHRSSAPVPLVAITARA
jgi:hypothetical protein